VTLIGHLSHDLLRLPSGDYESLGGAVAYASLTLTELGSRATIISKVGYDFDKKYEKILTSKGVDTSQVFVVRRKRTTRFINDYRTGERRQYVEAVCSRIRMNDLKGDKWISSDAVYFGPIISEISEEIIRRSSCRGTFSVIDPQGYCRLISSNGRVVNIPWKAWKRIARLVNVVKASIEEARVMTGLHDEIRIAKEILKRGTEIVIITLGRRGSILAFRDSILRVPTISPPKEVDSTGAGDIYLATFLQHLLENRDPIVSGCLASIAASLSVQTIGLEKIPSRESILKAFSTYKMTDKVEVLV